MTSNGAEIRTTLNVKIRTPTIVDKTTISFIIGCRFNLGSKHKSNRKRTKAKYINPTPHQKCSHIRSPPPLLKDRMPRLLKYQIGNGGLFDDLVFAIVFLFAAKDWRRGGFDFFFFPMP